MAVKHRIMWDRDLLMELACSSSTPVFPVRASLSLPAKSTSTREAWGVYPDSMAPVRPLTTARREAPPPPPTRLLLLVLLVLLALPMLPKLPADAMAAAAGVRLYRLKKARAWEREEWAFMAVAATVRRLAASRNRAMAALGVVTYTCRAFCT
jgi:hypothetical protein